MRTVFLSIMGLFFFFLMIPASFTENNSSARLDVPGEIYRIFKNPNTDLYARIYDNIEYKTPKIAAERLAHFTRMPKEAISGLANGEFHASLLPYCGNVFSAQERCQKELLDAFTFEIELAELEIELEEQVYATEVWSNGSLDDSKFDLLVDLNIIDLILFGQRSNMFLERFPAVPDQSQETKEEQGEQKKQAEKDGGGGVSFLSLLEDGKETGSGQGGTAGETEKTGKEAGVGIAEGKKITDFDITDAVRFFGVENLRLFEEREEINQCVDPDALELKTFNHKEEPFIEEASETLKTPLKKYATNVPRGGEGYPNLPYKIGDAEKTCDGEKLFGMFCIGKTQWCLTPNKKSGKETDMLYFYFNMCVDVQFVMVGDAGDLTGEKGGGGETRAVGAGQSGRSAVGYSETDNCINCHVVYINKILKDLLNMPLTPRRNTKTANFEISSAWQFLADAGFSVIVSSKPVLTKTRDPFESPGSEKGSGISAKDEFKDTMEKIDASENRVETGGEVSTHNLSLPGDLVHPQSLQRVRPGTTIEETIEQIRKRLSEIDDARSKTLIQIEMASKVSDNGKYWQGVSQSFASFYGYMKSIQQLYHFLGDRVALKFYGDTIECRVKQDMKSTK